MKEKIKLMWKWVYPKKLIIILILLLIISVTYQYYHHIQGTDCGCLVKYFANMSLANSAKQEITVETPAGIRRAKVYKAAGNVTAVRTGMGKPAFKEKDIPVILAQVDGNIVDIKSMITCAITINGRELLLSLVSMGNPHAIYFCQDPVSDFPLSQLGPKVEQHKIFPRGVNFEVARVLNRRQIEARVWERGVGETLACGSGACAVAVMARLLGYNKDNKVDIKLPGGILNIEWDGAGEVFLTGPAETVFTGEWPD